MRASTVMRRKCRCLTPLSYKGWPSSSGDTQADRPRTLKEAFIRRFHRGEAD
jgi:hypothetical protein